ncbi:AMP-binding protein [Streptomyces sp. Li-HN-5-11]|uniref:AMP-binding protein n=1 Tax=Streptomyces sp. Li-HN-5-11 TaxID=3075432 RepID=UPI0028AAB4F5|nr:AMP-binding protein [Streptomyces sp. Li-HN-5-11]WNM31894.1 AMP-binding protein [Streptomyces sp. Li-HN-5-11]
MSIPSAALRPLPSPLVARYEAAGWWTRETLGDLLARGLAKAEGVEFRVHSETRPWAGTFAEVERVARRLAAGLRTRGVGPGDVVAMQLPNWMEAAAVFWASAFLGAVVVPVVHFYGSKELGYILRATRPKAFFAAEGFGRLRFRPELCEEVPVVGVVGRDFDALLADEPLPGVLSVDPGAPALIAFTSGTTRDPKGVIHSHQTLGYETRQLAASYPPDRGRQFTVAPVGHFIGMVNAFLIPVLDASPVHLGDTWNPAQALALMRSDGLTVGGGATYYMTSLLDHPDCTPEHLACLRYAGLGGAAVSSVVTSRLETLGITVFRAYGSTEHPSVTCTPYDGPAGKRLHTDGVPLPGVEVKLAGDGEILTRGPDLCIGYTDPRLTRAAFDADGWYRTGDIGSLDAEGWLTITDRKADVIIRGGENISALEVEETLLGLPGVAEAAVVGAPDPRLGERAAAVLRMRSGWSAPSLAEVRLHFERAGLARQKWPEEIHAVDDFPRTPSGKVKKFVLRDRIATRSFREYDSQNR